MPNSWLDFLGSDSGQGDSISLGGRQNPADMGRPFIGKGIFNQIQPTLPDEETFLSPLQEVLFRQWLEKHKDVPGVKGWDQPDTFYDIRGFFNDKERLGQWKPGDHGPDTYKKHGHPTFSVESKYSRGLQDGGQWLGETLIDPPMPSHLPTSLEAELLKRLK